MEIECIKFINTIANLREYELHIQDIPDYEKGYQYKLLPFTTADHKWKLIFIV